MASNFSCPTLLASRPFNPCASNPTIVKLPNGTLVLLDYYSPVLVMRFDLLELIKHGLSSGPWLGRPDWSDLTRPDRPNNLADNRIGSLKGLGRATSMLQATLLLSLTVACSVFDQS